MKGECTTAGRTCAADNLAAQHSVTNWIGLLATGNANAAEPLWKRFYPRMVGLARRRLQGVPDTACEAEDVALSAFHQFCRAAEQNEFRQLGNRQDLWQILGLLTTRKALDHHRLRASRKRAGTVGPLHDDVADSGPDPALTAMWEDQVSSLMNRLDDDELRQVAKLKLEGLTNEEIGSHLRCTIRTVTRRLALIRSIWQGALEEAEK